MIFKDVYNRQETQLAYRIKYWPGKDLSPSALRLIRKTTKEILTKEELLDCMMEVDGKDCLILNDTSYEIVWAFNNMPTRNEFETMIGDRRLMIEYRVSPVIAGSAVAIINWTRN